jgi:hypothetical protein
MAKNKGKKSGKGKSPGKNPIAKRPATPAAVPSASAASMAQRVTALEGHIAALNAFTGIKSTDDDDREPITFSLASGGPKMVRLTLDGTELILLGSDPKQSQPRPNGTVVSVFMETWGDPGQQASIDVTNAGPTPMTSSVLTSGHTADARSLKTKF